MFSLRKSLYTVVIAAAAAAFSINTAQGQGAASTICKDGTASASSGRGACSGHGGVDKAATKKAAKAAKKAAKAAKKGVK